MFRQQLSNLTRLTTSTLRYASSSTVNLLSPFVWTSQDTGLPSPQLIEFWISETQLGLDAMLNDQFDVAESILVQHAAVSPFHAVGYALMAYVEAMLGFDPEKIQVAIERIAAAEDLARQLGKRARRRGWRSRRSKSRQETENAGLHYPHDIPRNSRRGSSDCSVDESTDSHLMEDLDAVEAGRQAISISFASADQDGKAGNDSSSTTSSNITAMTAPEYDDTLQSSTSSPASPSQLPPPSPPSPPSPPPLPKQAGKSLQKRSIELQSELLEVNCMLMAATIQFLRNSWIEYMKAAYRLRKAYKRYEQLFEVVTGQRTNEFASNLRQQRKCGKPAQPNGVNLPGQPRRSGSFDTSELPTWESDKVPPTGGRHTNWSDKRFSLFNLPSVRKPSMDSIRASWEPRRRSSFAGCENSHGHDGKQDNQNVHDSTVESGVLFGIGLFSLIFSLLPPKVNKILNTLGFHSSRPFALHVLQRSYNSHGLYSSLSALTLLVYYTNLSLFIHPHLLPSSMSLENARSMLDRMKSKYPNSKIWELLEGKLCKMEGKPRKGVEILRDVRRRHSIRIDLGNSTSHCHSRPERVGGTGHNSKRGRLITELAQLQALAVYEMGWGQIFLGDYFQASETFFQLESMNNWSRAFYHYIATCCMFANEQYDKAAIEYHQIPGILDRKRQLGGRLLPNEVFAERKIKRWREKAQQLASEQASSMEQVPFDRERLGLLDGNMLRHVVPVNPLWELIYLWNGVAQLSKEMLYTMRKHLEDSILQQSQDKRSTASDRAILQLLVGVVTRELGDHGLAEDCFRHAIALDKYVQEDQWVVPYAMYELSTLLCFQSQLSPKDTTTDRRQQRLQQVSDARQWIKRSEQFFLQRRATNNNGGGRHHGSSATLSQDDHNHDHGDRGTHHTSPPDQGDYYDWESRLHIRCQLLLEKLNEIHDSI